MGVFEVGRNCVNGKMDMSVQNWIEVFLIEFKGVKWVKVFLVDWKCGDFF